MAENLVSFIQAFLIHVVARSVRLVVIAADVGGVSESLLSGKTSVLVKPKDVKAMAEAIIFYANNPEVRLHQGKASSEFVRENSNIESMLDAFENLYCQ